MADRHRALSVFHRSAAPGLLLAAGVALAQQAPTPRQALAYVPVEGVTLSGPLITAAGRATLGNNSTVAVGDKPAQVTLARGGSLKICASTSLHLSRDAAPLAASEGDKDQAGLMLALDRGALEANYPTGKYSDVVLTPDLRILISGPGAAALSLRVNRQGDTCIDNHGDNAPYVTVSSLMDGGVYRVQANQRVLFEHGSLQQVVDREANSCGCPDEPASSPSVAVGHLGGPSSNPADTAFPTAVSEGLAAPSTSATTPIVPSGQAHAQVTATLSSDTPPGPPPPASPAASTPAAQLAPQPAQRAPHRGLFRSIGHFFAKILDSN